jgi:hypothetical protein
MKEKEESPKPPFCTATFQQEAASKLNLKVKDAMSIAQKLFEAGRITYMRTDDTSFADEFIPTLKNYIEGTYGKSTYTKPTQYFIQEKGLKTGDYTIAVQLPNEEVINFKDKIVIERKADLNELCCNLFDSKSKDEEGLTRFERELKRGYEQGIKIHLLVEVSDMHSKILNGKHFRYDKASKVSPQSFYAMLHALASRYNVSIWYTDKKDSARLIHDILYYQAREHLKGLG